MGSDKEKYKNETNFVSNLLVKTVQRIGGQTNELILSSYDFNLSVLENSKFLGISKSSIYQCIKDNGLVVRKEEEFVRFKDTYLSLNNKDRTIRKMMKYGFSKFKCEKYIMLVRSN